MASASDYNTRIIEEFRATGGHPGGEWAGTSMILIHHLGAKSGIERVTPLGCFPLGGGRFAIVASSGGSPVHPDWYHNLKASPMITVEIGTETSTAAAEELAGTARAELWPKLVARYPTLGAHQAKTTRQFPVFMLTRQDWTAVRAARFLPASRCLLQRGWQRHQENRHGKDHHQR